MIVPKNHCRPNPSRAIFVHGTIDKQMVHSLSPRIIALQNESRDPISVYIDSTGGNVSDMESLLRILHASDQDFADPCHVITIVTSRAASAAADLLSSGDYAIAFPGSSILYHGVRTFRDTPLTVQTISALNQILRLNNDTYAMKLARESEFRFMFRFMSTKNRNVFEEIRKNSKKEMTDLECFLKFISDNISDQANKVLETARERQEKYNALLNIIITKTKKISGDKRLAQIEGAFIKAIVDFEVQRNKGDKTWTFKQGGIIRLNDDFFLFDEYMESFESERFKRLCKRYGNFVLTEADSKEIEEAPEANRDDMMIKKVQPHLRPLWAFFVAFCHALQEGENDLTATDAFWLGLIDEVMGMKGLPSIRLILEHEPDEPKESEA